jgi:hypothetical protein
MVESASPTLAAAPRRWVLAAGLALVVCGGFQLAFARYGLNLRDEGYLWYGVVRVLAGEVPLRDFQSYDPGRYYWCAAFTPLFGEGILALRVAAAVFAGGAMFLALLALGRVVRGATGLALAALALQAWMFPSHKLFEHGITLAAVWVAVRYLERASGGRALVCGLFTGAMAFFGRNHGVYLLAIFVALVAYERWKSGPGALARPVASGALARHLASGALGRRLGAFGLGVGIGYAPGWLMALLVPGFARAVFAASISVAERGTNLPTPYPWPWLVPHAGLPPFDLAVQLAADVAFLLPVVVLGAGLLVALRARGAELAARAPVIAATFVGLVYVHHYAVRSDLPHLAQGGMPLVVGALALLAGSRPAMRALGSGLVLVVSVLVALKGNLQLRQLTPWVLYKTVDLDVAGDRLRVQKVQALALENLVSLVAERVPPDAELFVAPTRPMFYPLLGKRSPTWWIYFLWPASEAEQEETIRRLEERDVRFVLLNLKPFEDDPAYSFAETNPRVQQWIEERFESVVERRVPPEYAFYRRR